LADGNASHGPTGGSRTQKEGPLSRFVPEKAWSKVPELNTRDACRFLFFSQSRKTHFTRGESKTKMQQQQQQPPLCGKTVAVWAQVGNARPKKDVVIIHFHTQESALHTWV